MGGGIGGLMGGSPSFKSSSAADSYAKAENEISFSTGSFNVGGGGPMNQIILAVVAVLAWMLFMRK